MNKTSIPLRSYPLHQRLPTLAKLSPSKEKRMDTFDVSHVGENSSARQPRYSHFLDTMPTIRHGKQHCIAKEIAGFGIRGGEKEKHGSQKGPFVLIIRRPRVRYRRCESSFLSSHVWYMSFYWWECINNWTRKLSVDANLICLKIEMSGKLKCCPAKRLHALSHQIFDLPQWLVASAVKRWNFTL